VRVERALEADDPRAIDLHRTFGEVVSLGPDFDRMLAIETGDRVAFPAACVAGAVVIGDASYVPLLGESIFGRLPARRRS